VVRVMVKSDARLYPTLPVDFCRGVQAARGCELAQPGPPLPVAGAAAYTQAMGAAVAATLSPQACCAVTA